MFYSGIVVDCLELALFFIGLYYVAAAAFSLIPRRAEKDGGPMSFAVIIPAHNEESVISGAVKSAYDAADGKSEIRVYAVCDNCADRTAEAAARAGARVITRTGGKPNKALALKYAAERIFEEYEPDCVALIDADNLVEKGFYGEMSRALGRGFTAVQGRIETKNPNKSWLTAAYSLWGSLENRMGRLAPSNIGLNVKLSGTGCCVRSEVFKKLVCGGECLAEDLEYTARLALMGEKTGYSNGAVVYDEKPSKLGSSLLQRVRWARGIVSAQGKYGGKLLRKGKIFDWLSLYGDFLGIFAYAVFAVISVFASRGMFSGESVPLCGLWTKAPCFTALEIYLGLGLLTALINLAVDKKLDRFAPFKLAGLLLYAATWIPAGIIGLVSHHKKEWYHTEHES